MAFDFLAQLAGVAGPALDGIEHGIDPSIAQVTPGQPTGPGRADATVPSTPGGFFQHLGQLASDGMSGIAQEGLGGLLDPVGMMDRQEAQRELRGNFQITDPAHPGAAGGAAGENQVSEAEFEKTARLYSDIRLDRTHMHFGVGEMNAADQGQYRRDTMGQIGRMLQTGTGRTMVDGIAHNPLDHDLTFHAHRDAAGNIDPTNANAEPTTNEHDASTPGVGANVDLNINPGVASTPVGRATDPWTNSRNDVTMFHEMTHAWHELRGTDDASGIVTQPGLNGSTAVTSIRGSTRRLVSALMQPTRRRTRTATVRRVRESVPLVARRSFPAMSTWRSAAITAPN